VRDDGNRRGGQANGEDDETCEWYPVVFEISRRGVVRGIEQHRRNEEGEGELRRYCKRGRTREESEKGAAERKENWIRCACAAGRGCQDDGCEEQTNETFEFRHVTGARGTCSMVS
jgi:hypothetical protein